MPLNGFELNKDSAIAKLLDKNVSTWNALGDLVVTDNTEVGKISNTYYNSKKAFAEGKNVKEFLNKNLVGDPKKNDKWNDPNYIFWESVKGNIPLIGSYLTLTESMSVLHHNLGQIADDLYRKQLNPLLEQELMAEKEVMASQGSFAEKKIKTMEMRRDFWKKELDTFKMNATNKHYEDDKAKLAQLELDIELSNNSKMNLQQRKLRSRRIFFLRSFRTTGTFF